MLQDQKLRIYFEFGNINKWMVKKNFEYLSWTCFVRLKTSEKEEGDEKILQYIKKIQFSFIGCQKYETITVNQPPFQFTKSN